MRGDQPADAEARMDEADDEKNAPSQKAALAISSERSSIT